MSPETQEFIKQWGYPIFTLITLITSGVKKIWVFGYQLADEKADHAREIQQLTNQFEKERLQWQANLAATQIRENEWKRVALDALGVSKQVLTSQGA